MPLSEQKQRKALGVREGREEVRGGNSRRGKENCGRMYIK